MTLKSLVKKTFIFGMSVTLLAPSLSHAETPAEKIQSFVGPASARNIIKPSWGEFLLVPERLAKLYAPRSYQPIWVRSDGFPSDMTTALRSLLLSSERHGLKSLDYWDSEMERAFVGVQNNPANWYVFELMASETFLRYARHLSTGRFDPEQVDTDIKFKKKEFTEYNEILNAVNQGAYGFAEAMDQLAPNISRYKDLMEALVQLKNIKGAGGWASINSPGFILKSGVTSPVIQQIRNRLNQLGYFVSNDGGNRFDSEFETVIKLYQAKNGLKSDGIIGTRSEVLRGLNTTVSQRIAQVEVTMEKLRWLPKNVEPRHIFVNLATTEFRLQDETGEVFNFNTVAGQPFRRTPSMRDQITFVNLNPTWTVPHSIAIKDKLPKLKEDPFYLDKHDMYLFDANTDQRVDPATIDWLNMVPKMFSYYIRQNPGPDNALGVVKFPLQNPWAIYMHDTNERNLFEENERHRSSGCVRLEKPLELAAYLLQDQPEWSLQAIQDFVPMTKEDKPRELERKVYLKRPMPVYFMYLTVEKNENGSLRFVDDVYGQDARLNKALANKKDAELPNAKMVVSATGSLQVNGTAGRYQVFRKVKAVRCDTNLRGSCDAPISLDLNQAVTVPSGNYLVTFENSMYPGVVAVNAGQSTVLNLERLAVPASVRGQKIRVYRDFADVTEQQKMLLETFTMNRHINRLEKENFGDLYLAGSWERDFVQRFTYEICPKLNLYGEVPVEAKTVCDAWNSARTPEELRPLYQFNIDGTLQEMWVTYPGDVVSSKHPRYLVSAPMTGDDFVAVFPGTYKVQAEGSKASTAVSLKVGNVQ